MKKYLVDSDILMDFFKKKPYATDLLQRLQSQGELVISILSVAELCAGWTSKEINFFIPRLYTLVICEGITKTIAECAGKWRHNYKVKGLNLSTIDTLIAATAIEYHYELVTRNRKDYPMPELRLYNFKPV